MPRKEPSRRIDQPEPGYFKLRLVKRGWQVPARVMLYDDGIWQVILNGEPQAPNSCPHQAGVSRVWEGASRIDQAEYNFLIATRLHALEHAPDHPAANPTQPIRVALLRPILPRP